MIKYLNITFGRSAPDEVFGIPPIYSTQQGRLEIYRCRGSHYIYERDGVRYPVPFHGAREIGEGLRKKIMKDMGLR